MALLVPHEGELQILTDLLGQGAREDWQLGLFNANITPSESDTASTYTAHEAAFTNYARKTLTRSIGGSTWNAPVIQAPSGAPPWSGRSRVAHSQYGSSSQVWTCGTTGDTIYGYFVIGASSGTLVFAEAFSTPRPLANGDTVSVQPVVENA